MPVLNKLYLYLINYKTILLFYIYLSGREKYTLERECKILQAFFHILFSIHKLIYNHTIIFSNTYTIYLTYTSRSNYLKYIVKLPANDTELHYST